MSGVAPKLFTSPFIPSLFHLLSATARSMHTTSSRSSPAHADTDLPTNENAIDANAVTEEPAMSIKVDFHENSTLEQASDSGIEPNNTNENPAVSIEGSLAKNMSDTLGHILDVLKGSTIAEERGKDDNSKFWTTYKKVSTEYDDDFLGRANDDMGIILTFAGLFSAVNSTFIVGMQPNPGDTTNALLLYLIQISVNGPNSVPDINTLSSSTGYSSSIVWVQTLAYASLSFSVLAAFGAVLGKQWLNSYKSARGRGTLEERGIQRQMKLDGVEYFCLQTVLQAFLVLLQISLLLFGLSLSANMWAQQTTISSVIICTTAFGILFYVVTTLVSVLRPNSPFQTPGSELFAAICQKILPNKSTSTRHTFGKSSAIRWILETSTNPEIVEAAAAIVSCVQWPPNLDASAAFARLRYNFKACQDRDELYVKYGKAMAHLCIQPVKINWVLHSFGNDKFRSTRSRFIRDAFMAGRAAYDQFKSTQKQDARRKHWASARTALRTIVVHGRYDRLSRPDDERLVWEADLRWYHDDKREPSCEEFDWLVDYVEDAAAEHDTDNETKGDALLALSAMRGLGSSAKRWSYVTSLIRCMRSTRPPRVRHAALRAAFEAREELASIAGASMPQDVDAQPLDELSRALLTAVCPNGDQIILDTRPDATLYQNRDYHYLRLIYALTKNDEWCQRLAHDGHREQCISLIKGPRHDHMVDGFYLLVIFGRIAFSGEGFLFNPANERWRQLITEAWDFVQYNTIDDDDVDGIPVIVTATGLDFPASDNSIPGEWLVDLAAKVHKASVRLQQNQAYYMDRGIAQAAIDVALSSTQGLDDELSRMVEKRNTSQRDDRASGS